MENYKEVTDTEKMALEKNDAEWVEPDKSFVDLWNTAAGSFGCYNSQTGYFELNGLIDLTYDDAKEIYAAGVITSQECSFKYGNAKIRTNLPPQIGGTAYGSTSMNFIPMYLVNGLSELEVINISTVNSTGFYRFTPNANNCRKGTDAIFYGAKNLKRIIGVIDVGSFKQDKSIKNYLLKNLPELTSVNIYLLWSDIDLSTVPKISNESLMYMIENRVPYADAANITITITLHPDTYARLTDELLEKAAEKQITFVTN